MAAGLSPLFHPTLFEVRLCGQAGCGLRFPVVGDERAMVQCPRCGGMLETVFSGETAVKRAVEPAEWASMRPLCAVLDNLRSAFNVGSVFRAADGAGFCRLYCCGYTATPEHPKVAKTALGAETGIPWVYSANALTVVEQLQDEGWQVAALETRDDAHSLFEIEAHIPPRAPLALVIGNEVTGVDPAIVRVADWVLQIPMLGMKESLNVAVAFGIGAYWLRGMGGKVAR